MPGNRTKPTGLPIINEFAAGIDIGSRFHVVAVGSDLCDEPVQTFQAFTSDLLRMADWLTEVGIKAVAMESTGVYWVAAYEVLELHGINVILANAREARAVPGRKSDVNDAQWLQRLHACGLLRASFRPGREIAALRSYLRSRERHLDYAASHIQHMQKGGKVLSAHTRKTSNRLTVALRLAAVTVGRTNTALGAFYRRLAARIGNAKAVTATARKIAILFYNAMRFGIDYKDPGADHYEQQYRDRVIKQLHRRAAQFGLILQQQNPAID